MNHLRILISKVNKLARPKRVFNDGLNCIAVRYVCVCECTHNTVCVCACVRVTLCVCMWPTYFLAC